MTLITVRLTQPFTIKDSATRITAKSNTQPQGYKTYLITLFELDIAKISLDYQ